MPCPEAAGTRRSANATQASALIARPRSQKRSATPSARPRRIPTRPLHAYLRLGVVELEGARGKYAALNLRRLPDRPFEARVYPERAAPLPLANRARCLVHAPGGEPEVPERIGRRRGARLAPREKLVVPERYAGVFGEFGRLRHLLHIDGELLDHHLLARLRVDGNLVRRDRPHFSVRPFVLEFERGEPENALAHRADAIRERAGDCDFPRTEESANALRVGLGLRAQVVDLPVLLRDVPRKRRRMERREVGIPDEIYREHKGIADLCIVHVEVGARRELPARHAHELDRRQKENCTRHRATTL